MKNFLLLTLSLLAFVGLAQARNTPTDTVQYYTGTAPSSPLAGSVFNYFLTSDGFPYWKNSAGSVFGYLYSSSTLTNHGVVLGAGTRSPTVMGVCLDNTVFVGNSAADPSCRTLVNADISASAAIAYSKLNLASSLVSADIVDGTIVNADVNASAAIAVSKLAAQTASRAAAFDGSGFLTPSATTGTELGYVSGVTSAIQTQLGTKLDTVGAFGSSPDAKGASSSGTTITMQPADATHPGAVSIAAQDIAGEKRMVNALGLKQVSTPASPSAGYNKLYFKNDDKVYKLNSGGTETEVGGGSGAGAFNIAILDTSANNWQQTKTYNADIETASEEWAAYADAAAAIPADMTAGSPNTTCARNTSSPINGTADLLITVTTGASRQGEGCSLLVNIPTAYRGKALRVYFPYTTTGTVAAGDFVPYAYDVTNTSLLAPSATVSGITASAGTLYSIFQTQTSTAQLRIGLHIARTSTAAATINIDDIHIEPELSQANVPVSDWVAYTPTFTNFGTVTNISAFWRRVGDSVQIQGTFTTGTTVGSTASITLPAGLTADSTKMSSSAYSYVGSMAQSNTGTGGFTILVRGGDTTLAFSALGTGGYNALSPAAGNGLVSSVANSFNATVPISGWSSGGGTSPILSLSDWSSCTFTGTWVSNTTYSAKCRRVGDSLEAMISANLTGAPTSASLVLTMPTGYVIDTNKLQTSSPSQVIGHGSAYTGTNSWTVSMLYLTSTTFSAVAPGATTTSNNVSVDATHPGTFASGGGVAMWIKVPISGWTSTSSGTLTAPRSYVAVSAGNGYGSTNTTVRRWTTTNESAGLAITYADSSTAGGSFTINESGLYHISYSDAGSGGATQIGITVNGTALTTNIGSVTFAQGWRAMSESGASNRFTQVSQDLYLIAGDIVRAQTDVGANDTTVKCNFRIVKVSN